MLHGTSGKKQKLIIQLRIGLLCQHPLKHYRVYSLLFLMPLFPCYCLTLPRDVASSCRFSLSGQETLLQVSDTPQGLAATLVPHFSLHHPKSPNFVLGCNIVAHCTKLGLEGSLHNSIQSRKGRDRASKDSSNIKGPGCGSKCHFYCWDQSSSRRGAETRIHP